VTLRNDIDVNPSVGAQFRMFETMPGINVVRAMHLDLSGRAIPAGSQIDNQRFDVEPWDIASIITQRRRPPRWTAGTGRPAPSPLRPSSPSPSISPLDSFGSPKSLHTGRHEVPPLRW
jgi:D-aspartate ligase